MGERLRVTAQLVDVQKKSPVWAEKFDEKFTDIFAVEDSIAEKLAPALMLTLNAEETRRIKRRFTESAVAYLGDDAKALEWLDNACRDHAGALVWLKIDNTFKNLRSEPGFRELLERINLGD